MVASNPVTGLWQRQFHERFLLKAAEQTARGYGPAQQQTIRAWYDAAKLRLGAAAELSDAERAAASLCLFREAALLLISGIRRSREPESELMNHEAAFQWLHGARESGAIAGAPEHAESSLALLSSTNPLALDQLALEERPASREQVDETVRWLQSLVEPRSVPQIRRTRWLRITLATGLVLGVLIWLIVRLTAPVNIARGKPASASSQHPGTPDPSSVNNGEMEPSYGVHTRVESVSWVKVDLQDVQRVDKIKVFNRGDGWFDDGLPLVLEVSADGKQWTELSRRETSFTQSKPWVWKGASTPARFVQVRKLAAGYVALSEIEVYGD